MRLVLALLAGVGALQVKNPLNEFRKKLAQWSLEDAAMRREVQKEMRREELVGEPDAVDAFRRLQKFYATILDEEEYRATRIEQNRHLHNLFMSKAAATRTARKPVVGD